MILFIRIAGKRIMSAFHRSFLFVAALTMMATLPQVAAAQSTSPTATTRTYKGDLQSLFLPLDRYMRDPIAIGSHFDQIAPILAADGFKLLDIWEQPQVEYHLSKPEYDVHVGLCDNIVSYVEVILRSENAPHVFMTMSENTVSALGNPKVSFLGDVTDEDFMTFEWPNGPHLYKQSISQGGPISALNVTLESVAATNCENA